MKDAANEFIIIHTTMDRMSVFEILKHTTSADFMHDSGFQDVIVLSLELNAGVFSKNNTVHYPHVAVTQVGDSLVSSCSCMQYSSTLCAHQAEVLYAIVERRDYQVFFDKTLRAEVLSTYAKSYGLESEPCLEDYFQLSHDRGVFRIESKNKSLIPLGSDSITKELVPRKPFLLKDLNTNHTRKKRYLVMGKHRYYRQLSFLLVEADTTQAGKIKNPIVTVDPLTVVWKTEDPEEIKFYTALMTLQNSYQEEYVPEEMEAVRRIVHNPLQLDVYYHDRDVSETLTSKSLFPVDLQVWKWELYLRVFKKEPFYEITGEWRFDDVILPFQNIVLRHDFFIFHERVCYFIGQADLLRVIRFFKSNNDMLLVAASHYDTFFQDVLAPLEELVHIDYSFIQAATAVQLAERDKSSTEALIYLHQEGSYISITPVMKYGDVEVPVYSRKQLFDRDQNGNTFKIDRDQDAEASLTALVVQCHSDFKEQLEGDTYFYLHKDQFLDDDWFLHAFDIWRSKNVTILGYSGLKDNRLNAYRAKISIEVNSGVDWFNAKVEIRYGKQTASLGQVKRALRHKSKFVQLDDGTLGILPEEWIAKIARYLQLGEVYKDLLKIPKARFLEVSELFEKEVLSVEAQREIDLYHEKLKNPESFPEVDTPEGLLADLRDYQRQGLRWLNALDDFNFGACLADDMGLGKTLQIIAFILLQREKHGAVTNLIVVPTSLLFNWQEEMKRFAPSIRVLLHYGIGRPRTVDHMADYEVVLTTYGMVLADVGFLKNYRFNYVVLDESQAIKNPNSERYKAVRLLQARNRIVLTGTPVENNSFDLYGQLSFACPGLLGSKQFFRDTYALPIDKFEYTKRAVELQKKIKPFILRRTKKQVAKELPQKTEMTIYCEMDAVQRQIYEAYERELREFISATDESEIRKSSMHVLRGLTRLRQLCNSPVLLKEGHSGENAVKIQVLMEQVVNQVGDHKILIFSQFVSMLDLLKTELEERDIPFSYLTGQTKDRKSAVHQFQTNDDIRVFLISLKAGGVGLNLTEADYVYLVDPWWNPAAENQAIDRSYRIGQFKNVVAVRLICSDTVEEKIMHLQNKKRALAQTLIRTDKSFIEGLSKDDLLEVLGFNSKKTLS